MLISQKNLANRRNSTRSTGPKSPAGKHNSARNAIRHGIFANELVLTDREKPEFDAMRKALHDQFAPATTMQQIAFDLVVCCCWRCKLALRREEDRLKAHLDHKQEDESHDDVPAGSPSKWYGAGRSELNAATRFLADLSADLARNGFRHMEGWREPIVKTNGQAFYDLLMEWKPMVDIDGLYLAIAMSTKSKMYKMPLPPEVVEAAAAAKERFIIDPQLSLQMAVKLVDERRQHLEDLSRVNRQAADGHNDQHGAAAVDFGARYVTTAIRDMERAVWWYWELKEQGR